VGISPDKPEHLRNTISKYQLGFALLFDRTMAASKAFGVAFNVVDKDEDYYAKLERASGETHYMLPVPAVFIVGTDGVIKFQYVDPNYRVRLDPELLIAAARSARKSEGSG
jgi:peroxiredoxin